MQAKIHRTKERQNSLGRARNHKITATVALLVASLFGPVALADSNSVTTKQVIERVKVRQAAFEKVEDTLELVDDHLDGEDTDWTKIKAYSDELSRQGQILVAAFPLETSEPETDDTRAKAKIWQQPNKFKSLMAELTLGFTQLQQASEQQDVRLAEQAFKQADGSCRSCHMSYRSLW